MSEKRYYIAYGSNLSVGQMRFRCPDAKVAGTAVLKDWKLSFKVHATIEPCEGRTVPVLVWEISGRDEENLDHYEGYPTYYHKQEMEIALKDQEGKDAGDITAMVYIMDERHGLRIPMKGYYDVLKEGYERFGFDGEILKQALNEAKEAGI